MEENANLLQLFVLYYFVYFLLCLIVKPSQPGVPVMVNNTQSTITVSWW